MLLSKISCALLCLSRTAAFAPSQPQKSYTSSSHFLFAKSGDFEEFESSDRRSFVSTALSTFASTSLLTFGTLGASQEAHASPWLKKEPKVDYKDVAKDIVNVINADPNNRGPTLVRLAWHSSGTYDKMLRTGGSGEGTIRFKKELVHGGNAGLEGTAVTWMEDVKAKHGDSLSYADLYTLGGVVAIKEMRGPTIPWSSGRVDALDDSAVTPDDRLPSADSGPPGADPSDAAHLRTVFNRMGFNDKEIVALSGAHALGRCHVNFSGYEGPWTATPTTFDNLYFRFLTGIDWTKRDWSGPFQYEDGSKSFMMLPTDLVLIQDAAFKTYVDEYANNQDAFFADFTAAFQKLEELGTKNLVPTVWA